jgi:4-amino-4-deoxy-L-arabinose transferase-like glycosyltransferase
MSSRLAGGAQGRATVLALLLLATFVLLPAGGMRHRTLTIDESGHYAYGARLLHFDSRRLDPLYDNSKMPFSMLNALPGRIAGAVLPASAFRRHLESIELSRYVTVLCATLLGWLVFRWAQALYGAAGGLLALALYVFDPNILAHGGLVTSDLYATWTIALAVWAFWRLLNHEGPGIWWTATGGALCFALAQLAKYTAAYLVPILLGIALGYAAPALWARVRARDWRGLGRQVGRAGAYAGLYVAAFLVVVNLGYWGQRTLEPLAQSRFRSSHFQRAQAALAGVPGLRLPVPWAYVEGLDWVLHDERAQQWNIYLLGEMGKGGVVGQRFPEYYAVAWLYKEPIATQLLLLLALGVYVLRFRRFDFRRNEWFLAAPVLFFAWYFTFVFRVQIGYRYALVVLPMLFLFTGSLLSETAALGRRARWLVGALLVYLVVSVLSYYPHFIPYFNELVWDRSRAYKILADSSLVLDQNHWYVRRYLRQHPAVVFEPDAPVPGTLLVRVERYVGLFYVEQFRWLRENFEPVDHVAHGHLLFRVSPEALRLVTDPESADWEDKGA